MRVLRVAALAAGTALSAPAQGVAEQAVGLILSPGGAAVVRAGNELALTARAGEVLFPGDALRGASAPVTFLYCPEKASVTLAPASEAVLEAGRLKLRSGRVASRASTGGCLLPSTPRLSAASRQHYGGTMVRALRPAAPRAPDLASALAALPDAARRGAADAMQPLEAALAANPGDPAALTARAVALEKAGLFPNALEDYRTLARAWPEAAWVRGKIFDLEERQAAVPAAPEAGPGRTFALLVGVSRYQKLPEPLWLRYAHTDAELFERHLKSPRGGGLPDEDVVTLTNEKATTAAVRNAFETFLKGRAGANDTVLLFLAAHGTVESGRDAYILTWDSDPEDLASTAIPMAGVQKLVREQLSHVGRVLVFVDVCRAGAIGAIRSNTVNSTVERLGETEGELLGLMASRPKEFSLEGPEFGGGHGAFSYFLLKALNGAADKNRDGTVDVNEAIAFVRDRVAEATADRQHPRDFGNLGNAVALSDATKPGVDMARQPAARRPAARRPAWPGLFAALGGPAGAAAAGLGEFREAVAAGRLLAPAPGNAFALLAGLRRELPAEAYLLEENRLRVALEDAGQQVLLRYLSGDQAPQRRGDFEAGAGFFAAARELTPESLFLAARESFCRGRALLFDRQYTRAAELLERAARMDGAGAYSFNALGIAYLERADYTRAAQSFRDASRRAPYWAYPLHNLALAHAQAGDYDSAIRSYRQAVRLAPRQAYLPYNLGLLYQRLNRGKEAAAAYRQSIALAPESPEGYNALGSLESAAGHAARAERLFRAALEKDPAMPAARHNLALLLAAEKRAPEAIRLFEENLARKPDYLASRLSLAETLAAQGQGAAAAEQYRALLAARPDFAAARLALAGLLAQAGDHAGAAAEVREALGRQPENALLHERLGDCLAALGRPGEARAAYDAALARAADRKERRRIEAKIGKPGEKPTP